MIKESLFDKSSLDAARKHKVLYAYLVLVETDNAKPYSAVRTVIVGTAQNVFADFVVNQYGKYFTSEVLASGKIQLVGALDEFRDPFKIFIGVKIDVQFDST